MKKTVWLALLLMGWMSANAAESSKEEASYLFTHVKIFDGHGKTLITGKKVLVKGNKIVKIAADITPAKSTKIIDAKGKVLLPGLIDAHTHLMAVDDIESAIYKDQQSYIGAVAAEGARRTLMRGFTTVRDAGGPVGGLKRAIDEGIVPGPRIFPSNAFISQTAGHGDFNSEMSYLSPYFTHTLDKADVYGWVKIADGVPEVQKAAREVLRSGASQLKVMASGSVTGAHDPIEVTEYTYEELKAIVTEAEHWGTYVMVHAYSDGAVKNAIKAGVKSIEHGLLVKPETFKVMKEKGVWLSTQCVSPSKTAQELGIAGTPMEAKFNMTKKGAEQAYRIAQEYGLKIAFGSDAFGSLELQAAESEEFAARAKFFPSYDVLHQATGLNAELLSLSGNRSPYKEGKLGVIDEGAYADILVVEGNPLENVALLSHPEENILLIMKDGKIYKNTLTSE